MALQRYPDVRFLLFGAEERGWAAAGEAAEPRGGDDVAPYRARVVLDDAKPSLALRAGRQSSMRLAIDAVADGRADGVVSAGNTGALMAMAKFVLKTLPGIDRPAIASFFPTRRGESVMLDLGANVECDAENLVQFALMGDVFARTVLGLVEPTVGLLNVGSEDLKGNDAVRARQRAAARRDDADPLSRVSSKATISRRELSMSSSPMASPATSRSRRPKAPPSFSASFSSRRFTTRCRRASAICFARGALRKLRMRIDPRRYNGAMFLGLGRNCGQKPRLDRRARLCQCDRRRRRHEGERLSR